MKVLLFQLTSSALPRSLKASSISSSTDTKVLLQNLTIKQLLKCLFYGLVDRWPLTIHSSFQKLSYRHLAQITWDNLHLVDPISSLSTSKPSNCSQGFSISHLRMIPNLIFLQFHRPLPPVCPLCAWCPPWRRRVCWNWW